MTLTLDIEHDDTTSTLRILGPDELGDANTPSLQSARIERQLTRQPDATDTAEVVVYRDAWSDVEADLDRTNDRFVIREDGDPEFGGRLADFERDGVVVSVLIDGPKRDAIDAEPSGGNDVYEPQPDSALVEDQLLGRVPTIDAGTVETVDGSIAFSESHASPGKSLTKLARDADAELRYRTTETSFELDYAARLGADRTDETLSPASATVLGEPRIREQITEDVTHVRVLGGGEGTAQTEAEAVAAGFDPDDDRAVYRQRVDKDIADTGRAESLAETLVAEYDGSPEYLEVEMEVPRRVEPSVGDEFAVELPAHGIDTELRVTTAERIVDADGDRYRVVLSNRRHTADLAGDERALELDSLSEGNAGQYYALADGEGWDALDSGEPYEFSFYRPPETIGELRAKLRLESRPYRLRAAQAGHTHDVEIGTTTADNADFQDATFISEDAFGVDDPDFNDVLFSTTVDAETSYAVCSASVVAEDSDGPVQLFWRDATSGVDYPDSDHGFGQSHDNEAPLFHSLAVPINRDLEGHTIELVGGTNADKDMTISVSVIGAGKHTHDVAETETTTSEAAVDPGIVTISEETVSGVDVTVGGESVASDLDHPIDESIDLSDVLSDGRNDIEITSDSLGELRATLEYEAIKNADSR